MNWNIGNSHRRLQLLHNQVNLGQCDLLILLLALKDKDTYQTIYTQH